MDWKQEAKSCRAGYKFCKWKWITCVWVSVCKAVNKEKDVLWMTRRLLRVISSSVPLLMNHFNKWLEMCFVRASVRPCLCVSKNNATTKWTNYRSSCTPRRVLELQTVVICLCFCEAFLWNVAFSNSPPTLTGFCWFIYLFIFHTFGPALLPLPKSIWTCTFWGIMMPLCTPDLQTCVLIPAVVLATSALVQTPRDPLMLS